MSQAGSCCDNWETKVFTAISSYSLSRSHVIVLDELLREITSSVFAGVKQIGSIKQLLNVTLKSSNATESVTERNSANCVRLVLSAIFCGTISSLS